jgi:hypothetical protein
VVGHEGKLQNRASGSHRVSRYLDPHGEPDHHIARSPAGRGHDEASQAAMTVNERLWAIIRHTRAPSAAPDIDRQDLSSSLIEAMNTLHKAARADLTIGKTPGG